MPALYFLIAVPLAQALHDNQTQQAVARIRGYALALDCTKQCSNGIKLINVVCDCDVPNVADATHGNPKQSRLIMLYTDTVLACTALDFMPPEPTPREERSPGSAIGLADA
eukprot:1144471-Pelagomonas_calceolata.AAC.2